MDGILFYVVIVNIFNIAFFICSIVMESIG